MEIVIRKDALILVLLTRKDQTLLVRRNAFLVLDLRYFCACKFILMSNYLAGSPRHVKMFADQQFFDAYVVVFYDLTAVCVKFSMDY